jgi:glutathione S-transferase
MNTRARRTVAIDAQLNGQIERVIGLWCEALTLHDDERAGLYGAWGIADAFWAPVAFRFRTYGVAVPELAALWMERLFEHPEVRDWCALAEVETEVLDAEETGEAR